jgi:hypothetical protein
MSTHAKVGIELGIKHAVVTWQSCTTCRSEMLIIPLWLMAIICHKHHMLDLGDPSDNQFVCIANIDFFST